MKHTALVSLVLAVFLTPTLDGAAAEMGQKLGLKAWIMDASYQWPGEDKVEGDGVLAGLTTSIDLPSDFWFSFYYMVGDFDYNIELEQEFEDIELLLCRSFDMLDVGIGTRRWNTESTRNFETYDANLFGPMLYLGLGDLFGESPVGWYTSVTWMFVDLEDDWDDGRHYILEAGLFLALRPVTATLGWRTRSHYSQDNDLLYSGVSASVAAAIW